MPATFTHSPAETERKEPGIGGKPPVDRRPTGGGGGGGDDWRPDNRGPRQFLYRVRSFVFFGLAADMMFFAVLMILFFAGHYSMHLDPRSHVPISDWKPIALPKILYLNTALLVLSSVTAEWARRHIFREIDVIEEWLGLGRPALNRTMPWLVATLILGVLFLCGQWTAWRQLTAQGFAFDRWSTPASYFFYVITGLHAAHLLLGLLVLAVCVPLLRRLKRVELRQVTVDATVWYWHTMGLAWVVLFAMLAAGQ
ncbi:MAG: cytochrome c oxidase subunit 3 [Terracidiphilus sp.]|nr:cytochrome c oxidase subunit 3 [Terracidiphilus sp.]